MPYRSFLRSRSQPKPRRNLHSRYADMMESIRSRSGRAGSFDSGSFTTRRTRSSSITSPSSLTNPTAPHQDSDHGRLGTGFSILKLEASRSQTPQVSLPRISALPPWLRDTITELDVSHPLRAIFPTSHDASNPGVVDRSLGDPPDGPMPRHAHPDDAERPFRFTSAPRIQSEARQPDSDTSSDELRPFSSNYPLYHNNTLLHLRSGSPSLSIDSQPEGAFLTATNSNPSSSARANAADTAHIFGPETVPLSASSLNHDASDRVFPNPPRNLEHDGIFRYNPFQTDSATVLSPSQSFVFERPIQVYFDSPMEDPVGSDSSEPNDYDPFKLDPDEFKSLSFKWAPFDPQTGTRRELTTGEPKTSARLSVSDEVLVSDGPGCELAHPHPLLLGQPLFSPAVSPTREPEYFAVPCGANGPRYIIYVDNSGTNTNSLAANQNRWPAENRQHHTTSRFRSSPASVFVSERSTLWRTPTWCSPLCPYVSPHSS